MPVLANKSGIRNAVSSYGVRGPNQAVRARPRTGLRRRLGHHSHRRATILQVDYSLQPGGMWVLVRIYGFWRIRIPLRTSFPLDLHLCTSDKSGKLDTRFFVMFPAVERIARAPLRHYPQKTQVCSARMTHRLCRPQIPRQSGLILNLADLARANGSWCYSTAIWTPGARPFGSNGAISGARQALHAFGVDDVDHCSELCSESCSKSCSQCGSLYPSTNGSFFVSAEAIPALVEYNHRKCD